MRALIALLLAVTSAGANPPADSHPAAAGNAAPALQLELVRESLTGTHYRYRKLFDGVPALDDYVVTRTRLTPERVVSARARRDLYAVRDHARVRQVREVITTDAFERPVARYHDEATGALLFERPLYFNSRPARVFDPNPVVTTNNPALQDRNDSAAAVPEHAYRVFQVDAGASLAGPYAKIVDVQLPRIPPADTSETLMFARSESAFEDVNAWFHVDRNQRHLQSLGYAGPRQIAPYAIEIDTHATGGADTSYFVPDPARPGYGALYFGVGGTDDAEDADLIVHEYGHAIIEWISPGTFSGAYNSQARALAEGLTDYWAFSAHYAQRRLSGRDPFCFADWDARCWEDDPSQNCGYPAGTDCLRRLDARRTMAEYQAADAPGTEHWNGQIFAGALVDLFLSNVERYGIAEARRITDTLVIEALFDAPPAPGFMTIGRQLVNADKLLFDGRHAGEICLALASRGIVGACDESPHGELTHYASSSRNVAIPDSDPRGIELPVTITDARSIETLMVQVEIAHPSRGDLRIELIAPDGATLLLQRPSLDAAADIRTTYGRDAIPEESLARFHGRSAAGTWRLRVADTRTRDEGTVVSWALIIRHAGDVALAERPASGVRTQVIPVVAHVSGANATVFRSDVRILNTTNAAERVTLLFTPSGRDGRTEFAAVTVVVAPAQLVVIDDVVRTVFATSGGGSLTVIGDVIATSRTYTPDSGGTAGQAIAPGNPSTRVTLGHISINKDFRTNIGATDASGRGAVVEVSVREALTGAIIATSSLTLPPFGHVQTPLTLTSSSADLLVEMNATNPIYGYASVVDNATGDPRYVAGEESTAVPAISAAGANGTLWTTSVVLLRREGEHLAPTFPLFFTDARSGEVRTVSIGELIVGHALKMADVVGRTFGRPGAIGVVSVERGGPIGLRAAVETDGYSAALPALEPFEGIAHLIYVESTDDYRTNLGLFSDTAAVVRLTLHDAAGAVLDERELRLDPMRLVQFPIERRVSGGRVTVRTLAGSVRAYASVVDNRSGDATIVGAAR